MPGGALPPRSTYPTHGDVIGAIVSLTMMGGLVLWCAIIVIRGALFSPSDGTAATTIIANTSQDEP